MEAISIKSFLVFSFLFCVVGMTIAQPSSPPATPIDGGLSVLLAAGGAYGLKKLMSRRKEQE
ncbi:MAG: hypothetical protein AAF616_12855 [Bacteroidota bacterium]